MVQVCSLVGRVQGGTDSGSLQDFTTLSRYDDFIIGDGWKIAVAVVVALTIIVLAMEITWRTRRWPSASCCWSVRKRRVRTDRRRDQSGLT